MFFKHDNPHDLVITEDSSPWLSPPSASLSSRGAASVLFLSKTFVIQIASVFPYENGCVGLIAAYYKRLRFPQLGALFLSCYQPCVQASSGLFCVALWVLELTGPAQASAVISVL